MKNYKNGFISIKEAKKENADMWRMFHPGWLRRFFRWLITPRQYGLPNLDPDDYPPMPPCKPPVQQENKVSIKILVQIVYEHKCDSCNWKWLSIEKADYCPGCGHWHLNSGF